MTGLLSISNYKAGIINVCCKKNGERKYNVLLLFICVCYILVAGYILARIGFLDNLHEVIFSERDSVGYIKLSDFIAGKTPVISDSVAESISIAQVRPFLFPLYLTIYNFIGVKGYVLLQLLLNVFSIILVFKSVRKLTNSMVFPLLSTAMMVSSLTFTFIALHAMAETLGIFLIATAVYCMVSFFTGRQQKYLYYSLFILSAATCVKPVFLPVLLLWLCFVIYQSAFRQKSIKAFGWIAVALLPVIVQLVFTWSITGSPVISRAGQDNIDIRYFPAVYGFAMTGEFVPYNMPKAEEAGDNYPEFRDKAKFMMDNAGATIRASMYLLKDNLLSGSRFVNSPGDQVSDNDLARVLSYKSRQINLFLAYSHAVFFFIIGVCLASKAGNNIKQLFIWLATLTYSVLLLSILTYWQGDRVFMVALPVWSVLYPAAIWCFMRNTFCPLVHSLSPSGNLR